MKIEIDVAKLAECVVEEAESRPHATIDLRTGPYGGAISAIWQEDGGDKRVYILYNGEGRTLNTAKAFLDRARFVDEVQRRLFELLGAALSGGFGEGHMQAAVSAFDSIKGGAQ